MGGAWRVCKRGTLFAAAVAGAYVVGFAAGLFVFFGQGNALGPIIMPTWLDVGATAFAAITINLLPSSRLRVLPVWLVCTTLILLRVSIIWLLLDPFSFGPGAVHQDAWVEISTLCMSSIAIFAGVAAVGMLATVRPPPHCPA